MSKDSERTPARISPHSHKAVKQTAILIDGGFYRRRAQHHWGDKTAEARANELFEYCMRLLHDKHENRELYRIFYYDCPPMEKKIYHPFKKSRSISVKVNCILGHCSFFAN